MDEHEELTFRKKKKQRRVRCIAAIIAIIVSFFIGFLIGYVAIKSKSKDHEDKRGEHDERGDFKQRHEKVMDHHKKFQTIVSEEELRKSLK